jgi:Fe-S-cluster containining protein
LKNPHFYVIIREIDLRGVKMDFDLCFCGSGKPWWECHSEIKDNTAMSYLFETFKIIENDIKSKKPTPICQKGCNLCCNYNFEVTMLEFMGILHHIQKRTNKYNLSIIKDLALRELPKFPNDFNNVGQYFAPCIFVDNRNGMCKIYEVRPLICRMYGYYSQFGNCPQTQNKIENVDYKIEKRFVEFLSQRNTLGHISEPPMQI